MSGEILKDSSFHGTQEYVTKALKTLMNSSVVSAYCFLNLRTQIKVLHLNPIITGVMGWQLQINDNVAPW